MESIWLAFCPGTTSTRVVVMRGPNELIMKAQLRLSPSSPRAVSALLEALALWEGVKVRAALVVDECSGHGQSSLHRDTFALFGDDSALYSLEWVPRVRVRRRDDLHGVGDFRDLERLLTASLAR
jgi:hypothetical protein